MLARSLDFSLRQNIFSKSGILPLLLLMKETQLTRQRHSSPTEEDVTKETLGTLWQCSPVSSQSAVTAEGGPGTRVQSTQVRTAALPERSERCYRQWETSSSIADGPHGSGIRRESAHNIVVFLAATVIY